MCTDYRGKNGEGYVRIYRFISAGNLCFLVAESPSGSWDEADTIARSQRWQKSFGFYWQNACNWLVSFVIWLGAIVCVGLVVGNTARKFRRRGYLRYGILIAAVVCGLSYSEWLMFWEEWLMIGLYVLALYAAIFDFEDDTPGGNSSNDDTDGPDYSDGTGTTIHYDL